MSVQMQPSDLTRSDRDELEAKLQRWVELAIARDFDAMGKELMAGDVQILPPDHPVCDGRAAAIAYLNEYPVIEAFEARFTHLHGRGDIAVGQGTFDITVNMDGSPVSSLGSWLAAYRKTTDGWKITNNSWSADAPMG